MAITIGSICSGIEAASVAWNSLGTSFEWFSEIAKFPSDLLSEKYPSTPNLGDMKRIPLLIKNRQVSSPDIICGGTPCQAFSLAGWKNGLNDDRGNLTLCFVDIVESNDAVRLADGKNRCRILWENVEGVLSDKTNAFGCLVSSLAGLKEVLFPPGGKWPRAGLIRGSKRNVAWRVLDSKYFGLAQQRRRIYVVAGGKEFNPEDVLFERHNGQLQSYPKQDLEFEKEGHCFEVFREYTDCLYSSYGTKWNGNAAAYNGSLFVVQDGRIRRLSPLETERLMGFPDNYTNISTSKKTTRYQGTGNSWAIPVVRWIGSRLFDENRERIDIDFDFMKKNGLVHSVSDGFFLNPGKENIFRADQDTYVNCTPIPEKCVFSSMKDVVSPDAPEDIYISPVGCSGIIRRQRERKLKINPRLEKVLLSVSSKMSKEEIERISLTQHRGKFSSIDEQS